MQQTDSHRWKVVTVCALAALLGSAAAEAQTASGQARAVQAMVSGPLGTTMTMLADTGTLSSSGDARDASKASGTVPNLLTSNTLHATTIGSADTVASEASLGDLTLSIAGNTIGAGFVMARALAVRNVGSGGAVSIDSLSVNGLPITVTGDTNQSITIPGGRVVINEQQALGNGRIINALHIIVDGIADVVIASATASVQ